VKGRIAELHSTIVTGAEEDSFVLKIAAPMGMPPSARPLRALRDGDCEEG